MRFELERSIEILVRTPDVLNELLQGLADEWSQPNYGEGTWSAHQILGHLIWGERTDWMPRLRTILADSDTTPFVPFDREGHASLCDEFDTEALLDIFARERAENVRDLKALTLTPNDFERTGIHPAFGRVTVSQLISTWTVHDLNHISQVCKAMSFQYQQAVGPWDAFLSILSPPNPR